MPPTVPFADLSGQVALVSGAGSAEGIGFAAARALAERGAAVALTATSQRIRDRAQELEADGHRVWAATADLTDARAAAQLAADAARALGPIDVLVNNAGMVQSGAPDTTTAFAQLDPATWRRALDRNLTTAAHLTRAVLAGMLERRRGRIMFVSSVTGPLVVAPGDPGYAAAKAGMDGLMRAVALEAGPHGVTANSVAPGWIDTASASDAERRAGAHTPVGRPGTAREVAAAIVFLAAPESAYVTGHALVVDGGNTIQEVKGG